MNARFTGHGSLGFTLLELIIVMTLLATLLAVAAPRLGRFMTGRDLNEESRRLMALTRYAREMAIGRGERMELWLSPDLGEYGLRAESSSRGDAMEPIRYVLATGLELEIDTEELNDEGEAVVLYWPDGSIDEDSPLEWRLSEQGTPRRVITLSENRLEFTAEDVIDESL